tara:strand:+ start:607 stop:2784 length:2178 start_codon:yes stop_codon:yes gene_type:complete
MAIEDYFKGSSQAYGQVAGSLLAGRRKKDKKEAKRALIASTVMATFGALQNQQKQTIIDGVNDTNEKYNEIFNLNKSEFEAYAPERALLKRYNDSPETFLNEEVAKIINNTDEATAARVTWNDVDNEPDEELRKSMYAAHNSEKQKLKDRMEKLKLDPRATTKTSIAYNQKATDEYKAALALVEDDPTKKGLIKAAWNRIFKTERKDGELVTTNSDLLDLQENLKLAKDNRTTFRDLQDREITKKSLITPLVFKDKDLDMTEVSIRVGDKLANFASGYQKYKGTDRRLTDSVLNTILAEDPNLSEPEMLSKGIALLKGNGLDIAAYRTREENKLATGRLLVKTFEEQSENGKLEAIKSKPELKYQLIDAYNQAGDKGQVAKILEDYKNINATYESYEPSPSVLTTRAGTIEQHIKNTSNDVLALADRTYIGDLANRVAHTEHLFKYNNPKWSEDFTEPELTAAAITFVMDRDSAGDPINVRMTKAHMLPYKKNVTEEYVLDIIPNIIEDFNNSFKDKKDKAEQITNFRDGFVDMINNNDTLQDDEKLSITSKIENILKDETLSSYENSKTLQLNITDPLGQKGLIDYHVARRDLSLNQEALDNAINNIDLKSLSNEQLKYLYPEVSDVMRSVDDKNLRKVLGLNSDVNFNTGVLRTEIRKIWNARLPESSRRDRSKIQQFLNSSNIKPVMPDNKFIINFRQTLLSSEGTGTPSRGYKRYVEKFGK